MPRKLGSILTLGLGVAMWHFGVFTKVWNRLGSGTRAMTGATAVEVGQDLKRDLVQSNLERALREYRSTTGEEPADLASLVDAGLLQRGEVRDEWNRPLVVEHAAGRLVVRSVGRDGQRGTEDDWTLGR